MKTVDLKKAYRYPIVPFSMYEYFINNIPIEETISKSKDILDFCTSQKAGSNFLLEFHKNEEIHHLQKTNRFYVSTNGGKIIKRNKNTNKEIGVFAEETTTVLNDYDTRIPFDNYCVDFDFYIKEAHKYIDEIENSVGFDEVKQEKLGSIVNSSNNTENKDNSGIEIKPIKFRYSQGSYNYDTNAGVVYRGISSIKYVTVACANELYSLKDNQYNTFTDLLVDLEENTSVNKRQIEILIKLGFFDEFGYNKKLLKVFEEFNSGKNKYTKTLKDKTKESRLELLRLSEKDLPNEKISPIQQFDFERDILGTIQTIYPTLDKRYVYVLQLSEKYAPKIGIYCLRNGVQSTLKIQRKIFENNNFLPGDILYCKSFDKKNSVRYVNGQYEDIPDDYTWWLSDYKILSKEEYNKLINK